MYTYNKLMYQFIPDIHHAFLICGKAQGRILFILFWFDIPVHKYSNSMEDISSSNFTIFYTSMVISVTSITSLFACDPRSIETLKINGVIADVNSLFGLPFPVVLRQFHSIKVHIGYRFSWWLLNQVTLI